MIPVFAVLLAVVSAVLESDRIDDGRDIRHGLLLAARVIAILAFALVAWLLVSLSWLDLGLQLMMSPGLFAATHRLLLNTLRRERLAPWYVSPSNRYDWAYIVLAKWRLTNQFIAGERLAWQVTHRSLFFVLRDPDYTAVIRLAGVTAYKVELVFTGVALALRLITS